MVEEDGIRRVDADGLQAIAVEVEGQGVAALDPVAGGEEEVVDGLFDVVDGCADEVGEIDRSVDEAVDDGVDAICDEFDGISG